jgi:hypothetical protein
MADSLDQLTASLAAAFAVPTVAATNAPQIGYLLHRIRASFPADYSDVLATVGLDQTTGHIISLAGDTQGQPEALRNERSAQKS